MYNDPDARLKKVLELFAVRTVIDIGANEGQFAEAAFASGFSGQIISFEPLQEQNQNIALSAKNYSGRWKIAPPCALGNKNGVVDFHAAHGHAASSVLPPNAALTSLGDQYGTQEKVSVRMARLDDVMATDYPGAKYIFVKIDVQGYELDVLRGGAETLDEAIGVMLELSLRPLYEGQALADEIHQHLISKGFLLWDVVPGFRDRVTGQLLQYDGIYVRGKKVAEA